MMQIYATRIRITALNGKNEGDIYRYTKGNNSRNGSVRNAELQISN